MPLNQSFSNMLSLSERYSTDLSHFPSILSLRIAYLREKIGDD